MKIGIYGGSFNPPHLGHLRAAVAAAHHLTLDELWFVPTGVPPHKQLAPDSPTARQRMQMLALLAEQAELESGIPARVSDIEIHREGKSYTADTLRTLRGRYPGDALWLLMGTDMFLTLQDWYQPEAILRCADICAFGRREADTGDLLAVQRDYLTRRWPDANIVTLTLPNLVDISSTELRASLRNGGGARYLTPQVYGYILREGLYGTKLDLKRLTLDELRPVALSFLKAKRVPHVLGVEEEAIRLAERYGADVAQARIAALLHDCTKKLAPDEQLALCAQYGIALDELERANDKLLHAKTGAAIAREVFGADEAVCEAIRWHTTGKAGMTTLQKVVYLADYIEPNRTFDGVDALRTAVYDNLDRGLAMGLRMSIEDLLERDRPVHPNTRAAYNYIKEQLGDRDETP